MTSQITRTVAGHWEINVTGSILAPGNRVAAGSGEDYDTGFIDRIRGNKAIIRWDSGVVTSLPLDSPDVRVIL
jgi:hypothetical protein